MTLYQSNYLNHLAVVKDNFPVRPGEAQTIYRKMTVNLLDKYFFKIVVLIIYNGSAITLEVIELIKICI